MSDIALQAPPAARARRWNWLRAALVRRHRPAWKQLGVSYGLIVAGDAVIGVLVLGGLWAAGLDPELLGSREMPPTLRTVISAVVFAPIVETLLLSAGAAILRRLSDSSMFVAACSGVAWGAMHVHDGPLRLFFASWAFFVFTHAYLAWSRRGYWRGFLAAAAPHLLNNGLLVLLLFVD